MDSSSTHALNKLSQNLQHTKQDAVHPLRDTIESIIPTRFCGGNCVDILKNGDEIFPSILSALHSAHESIDFLTFVYWKGDIAEKVATVLADKAKAGVKVRVLLDAYGSSAMKEEWVEQMKTAGVTVKKFRPLVRWKFWENDHRTHRKIIIVDGSIGFTGGVGIASEWEGDARNEMEWRDTHFRVEGPIVRGLNATFLTDWRDTGERTGASEAGRLSTETCGDVDIALIDGSAQIGFDDAERVVEALIAAAQYRILIQTPYFNPTKMVCQLLQDALAKNISVDLLIPGPHIDKRICNSVAEDHYVQLIEKGARVWIYQPSMMHVKALLVDGVASMVGSINVNQRSMLKDEETAFVVLNQDVTGQLEQQFLEDARQSKLTKADTEHRSSFRRLVAKVLSPVKQEL
jgi:cardiolipin synthase